MSREERKKAVKEARARIAARKRETKRQMGPEDFVDEVRYAIHAVIRKHLVPFCWWNDPEIDRQIQLILEDALRRYKAELHPAEPLPTDYETVELEPVVQFPSEERSSVMIELEKVLERVNTTSDEVAPEKPNDEEIPF